MSYANLLFSILIQICCFLKNHCSIFLFGKKLVKTEIPEEFILFGEQAVKTCRIFCFPIIKLPWPLTPELSVPPSAEHTNKIFIVYERHWQCFSYHLHSDSGTSQELSKGAAWTAFKDWAKSA